MVEEQTSNELYLEYFDGGSNLTQGSRKGEELILSEILMNHEELISENILIPPERRRYVDINYTGEESNGSQHQPYTDIQETIELVENTLLPTGSNPASVVILGGDFTDPRIVIRKSGVKIIGVGFPTLNASTEYPAITLTNATKESLEAYRLDGSTDRGLLVNQGNAGPGANIISGFIFSKSVGGSIDDNIIECLGVAGDVDATTTLFGNDVTAPAANTGLSFNNCYFSGTNPGYFYCVNAANIRINVSGNFLPISIFNSGLCNFQCEKTTSIINNTDLTDIHGKNSLSTSTNFINGITIDGFLTLVGDSKLTAQRCSITKIDGSITTSNSTFSCDSCNVNGDVNFGPASIINCSNLNIKENLITSAAGGAITLMNGDIAGTISNPGERITWSGYGIDPPARTRYVGPNSKGYSNGSSRLPFTDPMETVEFVENAMNPTTLDPVSIYISGTVYDDPRIVTHKSGVNLYGVGFPTLSASLDYPALTLTNATKESLEAYRLDGSTDRGLLVNQGNLGPGANIISGFIFSRNAAGSINNHIIECLGVAGDIPGNRTAFGIDSTSLVYGGLHFRNNRGVEFFEGYIYLVNARGVYLDLNGTFQPVKAFNCALCKFIGFTMESFVFDGDPNDPYGKSWSLESRKNELKNCNINLGCLIQNYTWIEISNCRIASLNASTLTREMLVDNTYIINNLTIGDPDDFSCHSINVDGNLTIGDILNPSFINNVVGGNLVLSSGSQPLTIKGGSIAGTITDASNRLNWIGHGIDPDESVRYVDPNFSNGYSNGSEILPFTSAALARADDANAKIILIGTKENSDVDSGATETIDSFADTIGNNAKWDIVISKGVNIQRLVATTVWDYGTNSIAILVTDTSVLTGTIDVTLSCDIVADVVNLKADATSDNWSVKIIERIIS